MHQDKSQKVKSCRFGDSKQGIPHQPLPLQPSLFFGTKLSFAFFVLCQSLPSPGAGNHESVLLSASSDQERDSWVATLQKNIMQGLMSGGGPEDVVLPGGPPASRSLPGDITPRVSPRTNLSPRAQAAASGKSLDFKKVKEHATSNSKSKVTAPRA